MKVSGRDPWRSNLKRHQPRLLICVNTHFVRCLQSVECESCEFTVFDGPTGSLGNSVARSELILKPRPGPTRCRREHHDDRQRRRGDSKRPVADITTITDSIDTNFALISVDAGAKERRSSGGAYEITTLRRSRHAPVRLEVVDAPVDSALRLFLKNMRGPLEVYLHPMCQGKFSFEAVITETLGLGTRG